MFGGKINFGVILCLQHFYNKFYAKNCYQLVKEKNSIWPIVVKT